MRSVIYVLTVLGCILVVRAQNASGTNTYRPRTVQVARPVKQNWWRELNERTNTVVLGTNAVRLIPPLDTNGSQFAAYYKALLGAVAKRWVSLLEQGDNAHQKPGAVVLGFKLHRDGCITDMKVVRSSVSEALCVICQQSVLDPSPFAYWPSEMERSIGAECFSLTLAFKYPPDGTAQPKK